MPNVPLVHDSRSREMLHMTMADAERLEPLRPKAGAHRVQLAHTMVATEEEARGYAERLEMLAPWTTTKSIGWKLETGATKLLGSWLF